MDPIVITYDTDTLDSTIKPKGSVRIWKASVEHHGWKNIILGSGDTWKGFTQKSKALLKILPDIIKKYGKKQILVVTDARDVICNRSPSRFKNKFNQIRKRKPIVFGTEIGCCVAPMSMNPPGTFLKGTKRTKIKAVGNFSDDISFNEKWIYEMQKGQKYVNVKFEWFRALNAGMYCGFASDIYDMLKTLLPMEPKENNQALLSNYYIQTKKIKLDYNQVLMSNANTWDGKDGCFFKKKNSKQWINTITRTFPYFIQSPGGHVDNYNCYKRLSKSYLK